MGYVQQHFRRASLLLVLVLLSSATIHIPGSIADASQQTTPLLGEFQAVLACRQQSCSRCTIGYASIKLYNLTGSSEVGAAGGFERYSVVLTAFWASGAALATEMATLAITTTLSSEALLHVALGGSSHQVQLPHTRILQFCARMDCL